MNGRLTDTDATSFEITPDLLLQAYRAGIFPMAEAREDPEIFWVDPRKRGIIPMDGPRVSRSLAKVVRQDRFKVTVNRDFEGVMDGCADRPETWINREIRALYAELHQRGAAHSLEIWQGDVLAGGVYGVSVGAAFCGESMFSRRRDASKVALVWLMDRLRAAGYVLFDTQFITPHLASLGGVEISRAEYHRRLDAALLREADFTAPKLPFSGQEVLQRRTQTS